VERHDSPFSKQWLKKVVGRMRVGAKDLSIEIYRQSVSASVAGRNLNRIWRFVADQASVESSEVPPDICTVKVAGEPSG
jgi:hypothetical protein